MKKLIISVVSVLVIIIVAYSAGIGYYAEKFQANTTFGSVDISNLTLPKRKKKIQEDIYTICHNYDDFVTQPPHNVVIFIFIHIYMLNFLMVLFLRFFLCCFSLWFGLSLCACAVRSRNSKQIQLLEVLTLVI